MSCSYWISQQRECIRHSMVKAIKQVNTCQVSMILEQWRQCSWWILHCKNCVLDSQVLQQTCFAQGELAGDMALSPKSDGLDPKKVLAQCGMYGMSPQSRFCNLQNHENWRTMAANSSFIIQIVVCCHRSNCWMCQGSTKVSSEALSSARTWGFFLCSIKSCHGFWWIIFEWVSYGVF